MKKIAHIVDVDMGYGHARAAYALKDLSAGEIISANNYRGIPKSDLNMWQRSRKAYETISRLKPLPFIGDLAFNLMDEFQEIPAFYPRRDLSRPSLQLRQIYRMIDKGFGSHLIEMLRNEPIPLVTTFFTVAFMAEANGYPGAIYLVTTDADIARHWAPLVPQRSKIRYFAANGRCKERLMLYGVRESQIFLTGFPLPKELVGGYPERQLQKDLLSRICNLDPNGIFYDRYEKTIKTKLGPARCELNKTHPLTLAFSVGGAGAQKQLGVDVMKSLRREIRERKIRLALFAGIRTNVAELYVDAIKKVGLERELGRGVIVPIYKNRHDYFVAFSAFLRETDLLMTKPSELSFYTALGLPILIAPPIGSQEKFNSIWLQYVGGGVPMGDPRYTNEWLFDWLNSGGLARMAWSGYIEAPTHGAYRIEEIVAGRKSEIHPLPLIV
ncbi:MAG: hypothetical protein AAB337_02225 [Patescibacteria group bacterium]